MAGPKSSLAFSSLQKYTRKRQLYAKNGFYIAINSTGEVTGTSDESCLNGRKKYSLFTEFRSIFIALFLTLSWESNIAYRYNLKHIRAKFYIKPRSAMNQ